MGQGANSGITGSASPFGKAKQPDAPDFNAAAEAQGVSAHPNQSNAFGAQSQWTQGPDGQWSQQASLGGDLGQGAQGLESQIANQGALGTGDQARDQAITGAYGQAASRLDPQWQQRDQAQQSQLAAQGLDPGSQAYDAAQGNFDRARNDAYSSAMNGAIQQGTAAQQATFGENLASQMAPYQQLGALSGLTQQGQNPGATQYLPAAMAQYQGAMQGYGIQQAGKNSAMAGGSTAAAAALSDERLKQNIERMAEEALPGVPWATWEWKSAPGHRSFGVIAQDLEKVAPHLVMRTPEGFLAVNYTGLIARRQRVA